MLTGYVERIYISLYLKYLEKLFIRAVSSLTLLYMGTKSVTFYKRVRTAQPRKYAIWEKWTLYTAYIYSQQTLRKTHCWKPNFLRLLVESSPKNLNTSIYQLFYFAWLTGCCSPYSPWLRPWLIATKSYRLLVDTLGKTLSIKHQSLYLRCTTGQFSMKTMLLPDVKHTIAFT